MTPPPRKSERAALKHYAEVIALWSQQFDTASIAVRVGLKEFVVARYVANFRDQVQATMVAPARAAA